MLGIEGQPDLSGLSEWVSWETGSSMPCLIPARRIARILTDMRRSREGIPIRALGAPILVLPQVYVPFDQTIVNLLDEHLQVGGSDYVLDMGTGTGVLALVAAKKGARKVVATDILGNAVENARLNVERLGLSDVVEVRDAGDLFEPAPEKFDVIIFNPPWIVGKPRNTYDRAICDPGGSVLSGFMEEANHHLREGGRIYIIHSGISHSPGERSLLQRLVEERGMRISASWDARRRSRVTGSWERVRLLEIRIDH
jgi:methylase of polypeptide subunit release factors